MYDENRKIVSSLNRRTNIVLTANIVSVVCHSVDVLPTKLLVATALRAYFLLFPTLLLMHVVDMSC